ncbi:hypothetical protein V2J09_004021 [Rumex salicifolius]
MEDVAKGTTAPLPAHNKESEMVEEVDSEVGASSQTARSGVCVCLPRSIQLNVLLWNCSRVNKSGFVKKMNYAIRTHACKVITLLETKVSGATAGSIYKGIKLSSSYMVEAQGFTGRIWLLWDDSQVFVQIVAAKDHYIHTKITVGSNSFHFVFTYAPPTVFWNALEDELAQIIELIFVGGDFNYILDYNEREGGSGKLHNDFGIFREFVNLIDMGFAGQSFTWSRGITTDMFISKRLD